MAGHQAAAEITAQQIGKVFGRFTALEDISLTIGRGEFLTLLGPSGSGKTTFLMILAGFEPATSGKLLLDGRDITDMPPEQRAFGMVFQGYALFPHMSVADNIAFPLKVQGRSAAQIRARVDEMVQMVGLTGHADKRPSGLSGGQQQRVALARALAYEPPVLLLDEPFSALDKNLRGQMQEEMRRIHRQTGTTFVFVTHDQEEALALSTRIAIFEKGKLQQLAPPREVYEQPANRFVAEFLGDINILPVAGRDGGAVMIEGERLGVPGGAGENLAIRPEHMHLSTEKTAGANGLPAVVQDFTYLGAETRVALQTAGGNGLILTRPTDELPTTLRPGAQVWVCWPQDRGFLL
ncbi:ABC transporter ATP-binding protein [Paracoccus pacificus]|uniref:Spermidine/putrescine import ATP-binding protein PotA n=1 Tax=Paracoccus pacificus TaxID=1463598 RepID=A0ABW4R471_9RHOB